MTVDRPWLLEHLKREILSESVGTGRLRVAREIRFALSEHDWEQLQAYARENCGAFRVRLEVLP